LKENECCDETMTNIFSCDEILHAPAKMMF